MLQALKSIFKRDLLQLKAEIASYKQEEDIWRVENNITNSAGNLCLHLIGNLNTYIGIGLAKTDYIRHRDLEFSLKNIPRTELIMKIDQTIIVVEAGLNSLDENQMDAEFPMIIRKHPTPINFTLIHLTTHLAYHLGQINYHRRLLDNAG